MTLKSIFIAAILTAGAAALPGCATSPDPAEVCTAEWIEPRAARAVKELRRDTGRTIKSLRKNAEKLQNGGSFSALRAASMINSVQKLVTKIERGRGVKDLKTLAATCDDPAIFKDGLVGYLDDMKAPKALMDIIRGFDFDKLTDEAKAMTVIPET